jgi:FlgD Ig-like domain
MNRLALLVLTVALPLLPSASAAQWQPDGNPLSTAAGDQLSPMIVSDGAGGAIVTWSDSRSGPFSDIYAQRIDASGVARWTADGVALCTAAGHQNSPTIVSDGAGGAIVAWTDGRSSFSDIYVQRISASGVVQWTANGVPVCTFGGSQSYPTIASDGTGGVIVAWLDFRSFAAQDIYAQRISASGVAQWTPNGVAICTAANDQYPPKIVSDAALGAIVTWHDARGGPYSDIYAQRIDGSGAVQWTADGVALCTAADNQVNPTIDSDGAGGAIVTWMDFRSFAANDIYAQRISASGAVQWTANGVALCTAADDQVYPTIDSDGAGGAIVTWYDSRSGTDSDIYVQRIDGSGTVQWTGDGVALCSAADDQVTPTIDSDGAGGAIVTWYDSRSGTDSDIYAQRIDGSGAVQWTPDGVTLCAASDNQDYPMIVSNGAGGAIVAWSDHRSGTNYDIYAQRVGSYHTPCGIALSTAVNDQSYPTIVSDGAGGAIVTWADRRGGGINNNDSDIYAQRVSAGGVVQWIADGVAISTAVQYQIFPRIASDGAGGAIVTWDDNRDEIGYFNCDIYAQRIDASGVVQWTADGVALCTDPLIQETANIVSDGAGGAIVTWTDYRSGYGDIYAQRINASGVVQWTANGIALCTAADNQVYAGIASDGAGGAIVTWSDFRNGTEYDVYAQRVNAAGTVQWTANGVPLSIAVNDQRFSLIVSDGAGGAIATWQDYRSGTDFDIYAQRVNASGAIQWTPDGVALCTAAGNQGYNPGAVYLTIDSDGSGGAIVAWPDSRSGNSDIYAQRVNAAGTVQWTADGVTLCAATGSQGVPRIVSDGVGGAIVTWQDRRSGAEEDDIYAQRVNASGAVQWTADGVPICAGPASQWFPRIVSDVGGGAIVTWEDHWNGNFDIYAQHVGPDGLIPTSVNHVPPAAALALRPNYPNPFSTTTTIDLRLPVDADVKVDVFDVAGRRVRQLDLGRIRAGSRPMSFDGRDDEGRLLPSGVYFCRVRAGGQTLTRKMVIAR